MTLFFGYLFTVEDIMNEHKNNSITLDFWHNKMFCGAEKWQVIYLVLSVALVLALVFFITLRGNDFYSDKNVRLR